MTYQEQLKHPKWQKRRLEILGRANFECQSCGDKDSTLHAHHLIYRKGKKAWEYNDEEFECLCESCHKGYHDQDEALKELLARVGRAEILTVTGYVKAMLATYGPYDESLGSSEECDGASDFFRINCGIPLLPLNVGTEEEHYPSLDDLYKTAQFIHGLQFHRRRG